MGKRGYRTINVPVRDTNVAIYASAGVADALETVKDMKLYEAVKVWQIVEAAYKQGHKDGARAAFDELDAGLAEAKKTIPHRRPGRPRRR